MRNGFVELPDSPIIRPAPTGVGQVLLSSRKPLADGVSSDCRQRPTHATACWRALSVRVERPGDYCVLVVQPRVAMAVHLGIARVG